MILLSTHNSFLFRRIRCHNTVLCFTQIQQLDVKIFPISNSIKLTQIAVSLPCPLAHWFNFGTRTLSSISHHERETVMLINYFITSNTFHQPKYFVCGCTNVMQLWIESENCIEFKKFAIMLGWVCQFCYIYAAIRNLIRKTSKLLQLFVVC